ncbi:MAG: M48 family metalloprotease [Gammaproteobacteria bacterium]|nr:M48 family metalloprotease [Gammaproteobacteria bacterium]
MPTMNEEQFIKLVKKSELEAEENIGIYKAKLALFAVLGYLVIFSILLVLVLLVGGTLATAFISSTLFIILLKKKLIFIILPAIWVMLKALWIKFDTPTGYFLTREKFPELWKAVDELSKDLKSQPIHQIILTPELNASINQTPRLGVFGWQLNTLTLGLELLLIAPVEEIRSVIAHELGHLSGNHSKFNGWIYRVRLTWNRLMSAFEDNESIGARIMGSFFNWYSPKFDAYSFALARNNEYEADAISAELTSPEIATRALVNVHASSPFMDKKYWGDFYEQADHQPEPESSPYFGLVKFLSNNSLSQDDMIKNIKTAMDEVTEYDDTHPCLKDRVDAINSVPVLPKRAKESSAHAWLGNQLEQVIKDFDDDWYENNNEKWSERYEYVKDSNKKLEEFSNSELNDLSEEDLWRYGVLKMEFKSDDEALPVFEFYKSKYPDDVDVDYMLGQIFYRKNDERCLEYFRTSLKNESLIIDASEYAYYFLMASDRVKEAQEWHDIYSRQSEKENAAREERAAVSVEDDFSEAELNDELLPVLQKLSEHKNVKKLWFAQKVVKYYPSSPVYVIVFKEKGLHMSYDSVLAKVTKSIDTEADIFIVVNAGDYKKLAKKVISYGTQF